MRKSEIAVGMTLEYSNGAGPRKVRILDMQALPGPGSGKSRLGRPPIAKVHPMWITARFLDTNEVARVSTRGLSSPNPRQLDLATPAQVTVAADPASPSGVEIRFALIFTVPAAKAGIIDDVLSLLEGEGRVSLEATTTVKEAK